MGQEGGAYPGDGADPDDGLGGLNDYADSKGPLAAWI